MSSITQWMDRSLYPQHERAWDRRMFRELIVEHLTPHSCVLDIGAGRGMDPAFDFRSQCEKICGCDVSEAVMENPLLHEAAVIESGRLPFADNSFDMAYSCYVWEHIEQPVSFLQEVARVLKPGGKYLAITPSKWHYVPLVARLTSHGLHEWIVGKLLGRNHRDTFPTWYRLNSAQALKKCTKGTGLEIANIQRVEGRPEYLRFSAPTYLCGWIYEKFVNHVPGMAGLRVSIMATLQKK